jgi:hypothetical protein
MHFYQRPLQLRFFLRRERDDLRLARLFYRLQGIVVFLLSDIVGVLGGFLHRLFECSANIRG